MKADIHEGGHRIPFIVRWPGKVKAGSQSDFKTSLTNLIATCADITRVELSENVGEDSQSIFPLLLGDENYITEEMPVVHHSSKGFFAIRKGSWKLIEKRGSGGFSDPVVIQPKEGEPIGQLYNMQDDPSETTNLYSDEPEIVEELLGVLNSIRNK